MTGRSQAQSVPADSCPGWLSHDPRIGRPGRRVPCPLPGDRGPGGQGRPGRYHERILLGAGEPDTSGEAVRFAFRKAEARKCTLDVVRAWRCPAHETTDPGDIALVDHPQQEEEWEGFLSAVLKVWRDKYPDVEVVEAVSEGKATTALIGAASAASLLVVGHRLAERPVGPRTGPVTPAVIHHVGCPMAVVPHG